MKVLVTGGLGYVGSRIGCHLSALSGIDLIISTRRSDRQPPEWLGGRSRLLVTNSALEFGNEELRGVESIIHLATVNETVANRDPGAAFAVNCLGTLRMLAAAEAANVRRFIYFSTIHVYGTPLKGLLTEQTLAQPVQPYAIVHRAAEDFVLAAASRGSIHAIVVRLANAIGAPACPEVERWSLLTNQLCQDAIYSGHLELRTAGRQWRNFITLTDVARGVEHLLGRPPASGKREIYNLAGENTSRVVDLAELVADRCLLKFGFRPPVTRPPDARAEPESEFNIAMDLLKSTGFRLRSNLLEEIDGTLTYCAERRSRAKQ
jgi:UDP-glucose 4-epimerase